MIRIFIILAGLLVSATTNAQCGADKQCQRLYTCFVRDYSPSYRAEPLGRNCNQTDVEYCLAVNPSYVTTDYQWFNCEAMESRGESDSLLDEVFNADRTVTDKDGKLIEFDRSTGELLQVSTSLIAMKRRGMPIDSDVAASFEKAGIPTVDGIDIEVVTDTEAETEVFTLRGEGIEETTLRFDSEGQLVGNSEAVKEKAQKAPDK